MDKKNTQAISAEHNMELDVVRSVSFLESVLLYQADLESALVSLGFSYNTLSELDKELNQVRKQNYSKEAMEMYEKRFSEVFGSKYRKLSLKYKNDEEGAKNLNNMKEIMAGLYETSKEKDNFRYILFSGIAFNLLYQNREKCADLINANVVAELRNLTTWRQTDLMYYRNEFLERAQKYLNSFRSSLCKNEQLEKDFNRLQEWYVGKYEENWHNKLIELSGRCNKNKELEAIKDEVDNLAEKSTEQFNVLRNVVGKKDEHSVKGEHSGSMFSQLLSAASALLKKDIESEELDIRKKVSSKISERDRHKSENIDRCFVLPVLEYECVMEAYKGLLKGNDSTLRVSVKKFRDYTKIEGTEEFSIQRRIGELPFEKLQEETEALQNFLFCQRNLHLREEEIVKYIKNDQLIAKVILVQMLGRYGKLLEEEFKKEKTWFKMVEEKIKKAEEERKKIEKEIKEIKKATEQASIRAEQEAQRAEQTGRVSAVFLEMVLDSDMNRELRRITLKSQIDIVKAVVQHVMNYDSSPEQILHAIIKEVQFNGDQVIGEGTIDVRLIEAVVSSINEEQVNKGTSMEKAHRHEGMSKVELGVKKFMDQENTARLSGIINFLNSKPDDEQIEVLKCVYFREYLIQFIKAQDGNFLRVEDALKEKAKKELKAISTGVFSDHQERASLYSIALQEGKPKVAEFLKKKGANREEVSIDSVDQSGKTLLYYAAWEGLLEAVEFLVCKGADVHDEGTHEGKPIHIATAAGHRNIVEFFLLNRISVNEADKSGYTPLHYAAHHGQLEMVQFLIANMANIHAQAQNGKTPLDLAEKAGHKEIVNMLSSINTKMTNVSISQSSITKEMDLL
ncbi:ankyrin repeat domain-containing protein [Wolbachia endosymbiont (group A) of Pogonocherus hispidulus]|uniref:ankyrin repeat domain-containing protein n=1 Tax=Wolbachia endosymbiont (group A) of Pogonocherus hispidulus TaxID=3066136 RepID=UPI003341FA61